MPKSCTDQLRGEHRLGQRRAAPCPPARPPTVTRHRARSYGGWSPRRASIAGSGAARSITSGSTGSAGAGRSIWVDPADCAGRAVRRRAQRADRKPVAVRPSPATMAPARATPARSPCRDRTEVGQHTGRQHPPDVAGLARQRGRPTHPAGHPRLGDALRPAAVPEVAPGRPLAGTWWCTTAAGSCRKTPVGKQLARPGCRARSPRSPAGLSAVRPRPVSKPPTAVEHRAAQRHVAAHQVADRRRRGRLPAIAAAHHPAELTRPPAPAAAVSTGGHGGAADPEDGRVGVRREQLRGSSPPRPPRRRRGSSTMSPVEASMPVFRAPERPWADRVRPAPRPSGQATRARVEQGVVVVDHHDDLVDRLDAAPAPRLTAWQSWSQRPRCRRRSRRTS